MKTGPNPQPHDPGRTLFTINSMSEIETEIIPRIRAVSKDTYRALIPYELRLKGFSLIDRFALGYAAIVRIDAAEQTSLF